MYKCNDCKNTFNEDQTVSGGSYGNMCPYCGSISLSEVEGVSTPTKICPNCHSNIDINRIHCPKCDYDYDFLRVIKINEKNKILSMRQLQIPKNSNYEYKVVVIQDLDNGLIDQTSVQNSLLSYSLDGWRLAFAFSNEIGRTSSSLSFASIAGGINATIDSTILIFERCIKSSVTPI